MAETYKYKAEDKVIIIDQNIYVGSEKRILKKTKNKIGVIDKPCMQWEKPAYYVRTNNSHSYYYYEDQIVLSTKLGKLLYG